jgi:hypothetical protein
MTYGVVTHVQAPIAMYDAVHVALRDKVGSQVDGLLLHVGRVTADGFDVIEVWQSRDHLDRYHREVIGPVMAELLAANDGPTPPPLQHDEEFDVRGLVIPSAELIF